MIVLQSAEGGSSHPIKLRRRRGNKKRDHNYLDLWTFKPEDHVAFPRAALALHIRCMQGSQMQLQKAHLIFLMRF